MKEIRNKIFFPYGISNFESLSRENYFFVDKTPYVEKLETSGFKNVSFLRPRRIGKSLFVSILEYYYGIEHKEKFEAIFGKFYIGQHPTPLANQYYVLKMDFSAIDTSSEENAFIGFLFKIQLYSKAFFDKYYPALSKEEYKEIDATISPDKAIETFFRLYNKYLNGKIYLIIDEYDHFTNEMLILDLQQFKRAVTKNGYVRKFYESIKVATQQGIIDRVFITGVSPITLDSLTSGFNIIRHLTGELAFHDMMGFTEQEVENITDLILEDPTRKPQLMKDLREWYNGYRFHLESKQRIYNSDMVLYFCTHFQDYQEYPRQMLDPNIAPDHGKLRLMFEIQNPEGNYAILEKILRDQRISGELVLQFSFERGFSDYQFISFLYYMGYLTIEGEQNLEAVFKIPNYVIKELYWDYFAWLITERENLPYNEDKIREGVRSMLQGNIYPFMQMVEDVLNILSNRDYQNFDEKYIKVLIIAYIIQTNTYYTPSERETPAGYIDLLFIAPTDKKTDYEYIFELKYLKQSEASDQKIAQAKEKAKSQILHYVQADPTLRNRKTLYAFTLVFVKNKLLIDPVVI